MKKAFLVIEDGTVFEGYGFGAAGEAYGEIVFNTSMTGYQEILTDPSYNGQIVTMTYPEIGNYGVNSEDVESRKPFLKGFIVKEYWRTPSNWRSEEDLESYMAKYGVVGIEGVDTRAIAKLIRSKGAQRAVISTSDLNPKSLLEKVNSSVGIVGVDLVTEVTCNSSYDWDQGTDQWKPSYENTLLNEDNFNVVAYDFGLKQNILRKLIDHGLKIFVVPSTTSARDILEMDPDGIFLSNGPGDPAAVTYAVENVKHLIGKKPIFGICLGHQILCLALGAKTYKLKFGHRGANQPVKNLKSGKIEITSQNHGFAVDSESFGDDVEITHLNLNDNTVEGIKHKKHPAFSVQYHPEASPGPHDSSYLFGEFVNLMKDSK